MIKINCICLVKNGIELFTIEEFEIYFSEHFDIDSVLMGIRISKDQDRLVKLLTIDI
ncbi:MAG: hypothetical protein IE909_01985 [Campylobacterales bacterium]|nr:hypothetical protein [Campylobacterales bacterium]